MLNLSPWAGIAAVLAALVGLMLLLRYYRLKCQPHPEILRKLLHVGMGIVTLSFPWVFNETWPAWVLAAISVLLLAAAKIPGPLQQKLGGVVDGVARGSFGDIYFPISVALIFQFADRQPELYCIPILLLTLADAVAALIGIFYGHIHYAATDGQKSAEGSIAFFTVAFLSTHIPLLLFTNIGRAESLLLGITIGLLVMLIEAVAWKGLDNLLVPLGGYLLLTGYRSMDVHTLALLLASTVGWILFVFLMRRWSTLNDSALLGAALVGYLTVSLGGWTWVVPPLILYLGYTVLWPRKEQLHTRPHDVHAVAAVCVPGLLWLALARTYDHWDLYYPYTAFYAVQLAFIGVAYYREVQHKMVERILIPICAGKSWTAVFLPYLLINSFSVDSLLFTGVALIVVIGATMVLNIAIPRPDKYSIEKYPWMQQTIIGAAASALCLIPLYLLRW